MSIWAQESIDDATAAVLVRLEEQYADLLSMYVAKHDSSHIITFCEESLTNFPHDIAQTRILNLMKLLPAPFEDGNDRARAARTGFALRVIESLPEYGVDINKPLTGVDAHRGQAVLNFCIAFPEKWLGADSSDTVVRDELLRFVSDHAHSLDEIVQIGTSGADRLEPEFLAGYLDSTAPSLRDGFL